MLYLICHYNSNTGYVSGPEETAGIVGKVFKYYHM